MTLSRPCGGPLGLRTSRSRFVCLIASKTGVPRYDFVTRHRPRLPQSHLQPQSETYRRPTLPLAATECTYEYQDGLLRSPAGHSAVHKPDCWLHQIFDSLYRLIHGRKLVSQAWQPSLLEMHAPSVDTVTQYQGLTAQHLWHCPTLFWLAPAPRLL